LGACFCTPEGKNGRGKRKKKKKKKKKKKDGALAVLHVSLAVAI